MKTEKEKMLAGELYNAMDEQLSADRIKARLMLKELNEASADDFKTLNNAMLRLLPNAGRELWIQPPFYCDYGFNIVTGENVFFQF